MAFNSNIFAAFYQFEKIINPLTWQKHDELMQWAEECERRSDLFETPELYEKSDDPVVLQGYTLVKDTINTFANRYRHLTSLRILIHTPSLDGSPGGHSLFSNMVQALEFIGIAVKSLGWNEHIEKYLEEFQPTVFITSDHESYLSRINWDSIKIYRKSHILKVGLTASIEEYGNTPLPGRLLWAKEQGIDFYYSFRSPEYLQQRAEYRPFFDHGYKIFSIEFGANPLIHYPVPGIERDINYVFLASTNPDKWQRYFLYLTDILSKYSGFIDGPGWSFLKRKTSTLNKDRYLYARAKVGLNLHLDNQIEWASELNERTYMLAACGVPQLIDKPKLLPYRFNEEGFFIAASPHEYISLFDFILNNPDEAKRRALIAQKEVFASHTWFHRAEKLALSLLETFFSKSKHGLLYDSNLYIKVNEKIRGKIARAGGSVRQLLQYEGCEIHDINLLDGGFGISSPEKTLILDMHTAYKKPELLNNFDCSISSNMIEHSYNPILLLLNFYFITNKEGYQFHAIPNYRYTYDLFRSPTPLTHLIEDFEKMTDQSDTTHNEDYVQSAVIKHGWQREFHKKYPITYPYIHFHVFDEHNVKDLMEFMFEEVTVDVIRTKEFSDTVVLFRNTLNKRFIDKYHELINRYTDNFLLNLTFKNHHSISHRDINNTIKQLSELSLWEKGKPLRLHLGCGENHLEGYINIDYPPSEHLVQTRVAADIFADITTLNFPVQSVDEIRLHHVFEHFNRARALALLIRWHEWLKIGGKLHIETPDIQESARQIASDAPYDIKEAVIRHLFGSHEARWAYHYDGWYEEKFQRVLTSFGFSVQCRAWQWPQKPFLANIEVIAFKTKHLAREQLFAAAESQLQYSMVADVPNERSMHAVWCKEIHAFLEETKGKAYSHDSAVKKHVLSLVFSKDRALQLDATLHSFLLHCQDIEKSDIKVLYTTSNELHQKQYKELSQKYESITFVQEAAFREDVLSFLEQAACVLFLVDDNLFVRDFSLLKIMESLEKHPDSIGFSLRLGKNTTYTYMLDTVQELPDFTILDNDTLKFNWTISEFDFGYPLEVSCSLYRVHDILPFIEQLHFTNPNILEGQMSIHRSFFHKLQPFLLCFEQSVAFCSPLNKVQTVLPSNRSGSNVEYTPENLARLFDKGYRIDVEYYTDFLPSACHQEIDLKLIEPVNPSQIESIPPFTAISQQKDDPYSAISPNINSIIEKIQKMIENNYSQVSLYLQAAELLIQNNEIDEAKKYLEDALEFAPDNPAIMELYKEISPDQVF